MDEAEELEAAGDVASGAVQLRCFLFLLVGGALVPRLRVLIDGET